MSIRSFLNVTMLIIIVSFKTITAVLIMSRLVILMMVMTVCSFMKKVIDTMVVLKMTEIGSYKKTWAFASVSKQ